MARDGKRKPSKHSSADTCVLVLYSALFALGRFGVFTQSYENINSFSLNRIADGSPRTTLPTAVRPIQPRRPNGVCFLG